jgi:FAD/FMN-containing dehydrogenase
MAYAKAKEFDYPLEDIGCLMIPAEVGRVHYQFSLARNHKDDKESKKVKEMLIELSELLIRKGAFFSRPYGDWAEMVYGRTPSYYTMLKEFKDLIDPNNVMNPNRIFVL